MGGVALVVIEDGGEVLRLTRYDGGTRSHRAELLLWVAGTRWQVEREIERFRSAPPDEFALRTLRSA